MLPSILTRQIGTVTYQGTAEDFARWGVDILQPPIETADGRTLTGIWPDFVAPSKYESPDPRWVDPGLPDFRLIWKLAREVGYSIGLHGSMKRDCDLIAAPWTDEAVSPQDLIAHLCAGLDAFPIGKQTPEPVQKPLGRLAWCIQIRDAYMKVIDISVCPRVICDGTNA